MLGRDRRGRDREDDDGFDCGSGVGSENDDNARSIRTIVPHGLGWGFVDYEDEEQLVKQQREQE